LLINIYLEIIVYNIGMTEHIYIHVHNSYNNILHAFTRQVNTLSVTIFHHTHTIRGMILRN